MSDPNRPAPEPPGRRPDDRAGPLFPEHPAGPPLHPEEPNTPLVADERRGGEPVPLSTEERRKLAGRGSRPGGFLSRVMQKLSRRG
jgi:hypothetical protein